MDPLLLLAICSIVAIAVVISLVKTRYEGSSQGSSLGSSRRSVTVPGLTPGNGDQGNLAEIDTAGSMHQFLMGLHKQFGPIAGFWLGKQYTVSVASPSMFKHLAHVFERPPELFKLFEPLLTADSVQYANYEEGRTRRKMYDGAFSHSAIDQYYGSFQLVADEVSAKWATSSIHGDHIPVHKQMIGLAIKAIALTAFGKDFKDDKNVSRLHTSYNMAWQVMEESLTTGFPEPGSDRFNSFMTGKSRLNRLIEDIVEKKQSESVKDGQVLFIDYLMALDTPDQPGRFLADALTYVIGGFHTTGNMLTWAFYFLSADQEVQEKLATEIRTVLNGENVDATNIQKLTFLRQVQDETLRCSVLVPWAAKFQNEDMQLGGYVIPKKTPIITALGVALQDETYWPQPTRFDPERFSAENVKHHPGHLFSPFGLAGKRICPGYRFAYAESAVVLATLVGKYRFKLVEGQNIGKVHGLVTRASEELWLTVTKR